MNDRTISVRHKRSGRLFRATPIVVGDKPVGVRLVPEIGPDRRETVSAFMRNYEPEPNDGRHDE